MCAIAHMACCRYNSRLAAHSELISDRPRGPAKKSSSGRPAAGRARARLPAPAASNDAAGQVLYESGDVQHNVYFPIDSIISLLYVMADGASAEISVVGNEGLIGVSLFMGGETTPSRAIVQSAGSAYRLAGQRLKDEFHRNGAMQLLLLRYTQAFSRRWRRPPSATATTRWISSCAVGCCCRWIACLPTN